MFIHYLIQSFPGRFLAAAPTFGSPLLGYLVGNQYQLLASKELASKTSILQLHDRSDIVIPWQGGSSQAGWLYESMNRSMGVWSAIHGCEGSEPVENHNPFVGGSTNVRCYNYEGCFRAYSRTREVFEFCKKLLKPDGVFFISFPPWCNPFGGHQQMCKSKILSFLPYFHILPAFLYKFILKSFGEDDDKITGLIEIKDTAISIERFQRIIKKENYKIVNRIFYFINPNYEIKFNLKKRKVWKAIELMPYIRNFFITTNYYSISLNQPTKD